MERPQAEGRNGKGAAIGRRNRNHHEIRVRPSRGRAAIEQVAALKETADTETRRGPPAAKFTRFQPQPDVTLGRAGFHLTSGRQQRHGSNPPASLRRTGQARDPIAGPRQSVGHHMQ